MDLPPVARIVDRFRVDRLERLMERTGKLKQAGKAKAQCHRHCLAICQQRLDRRSSRKLATSGRRGCKLIRARRLGESSFIKSAPATGKVIVVSWTLFIESAQDAASRSR